MAKATGRVHYDKLNVLISDAGYQNLRTYPIMDNSVVRFEITVAARQSDGTNRAMYKRSGLFFRQAGGPVQTQGASWQTLETFKSDVNMDLEFVLGSSSLTIQVRNAGSVATKWVGYVDIIVAK